MAEYDWLDTPHVIYEQWRHTWARNERLLHGGTGVHQDLLQFDWEVADGLKNYKLRQQQSPYLNFPEWFLTTLSGHLLREGPQADDDLDFGTLGLVRRIEGQTQPTLAELIYFNVDNAGNDGSQWYNFWLGAWRRAAATGHRWLYVDAPRVAPEKVSDQIAGQRPWVVEYSPIVVPNWYIDTQGLAWAVVRTGIRRPRVVEGKLEGNEGIPGYMLLVRAGVTELGREFQVGGWWMFDNDRKLIPNDHGTWEATSGEIPMVPLYYERDQGLVGLTKETAAPAMSRPGITELCQCAVAYMNLASAADYDVWDAGASERYFLGVDPQGFNLAMDKKLEGSRNIPVPLSGGGLSGPAQVPQIQESGMAVTSTSAAFDTTLKRKVGEAEWLAMREATSGLDTSGARVEMGFLEGKSPRLALAASEIEQAQNTVLRWLELRADRSVLPEAVVSWTRSFDLTDTSESVQKVFNLEKTAGIGSPTLHAASMTRVVKEFGLASDNEQLAAIKTEYEGAADIKAKADQQANKVAAEFGFPNS